MAAKATSKSTTTLKTEKKPFELPHKKIRISPNIKPTAFISDVNHVAAFLAPGAKRSYVLGYDNNTKAFKRILNEEEEAYLKNIFKKDMSPYDLDGFWADFRVHLGKDVQTLNLAEPMDFITYKVLKSNELEFCTDKSKLNNKLTYKYLLEDLDDVAFKEADESDFEEKVYGLFAKVKKDRSMMLDFLRMKGVNVSEKSSDAFLIQEIRNRFIKSSIQNMEEFYNTLSSDDFDVRVVANKAVKYRIVEKFKNQYSFQGEVVANSYEQLVEYLKNPKFQEIFLIISEKVKLADE